MEKHFPLQFDVVKYDYIYRNNKNFICLQTFILTNVSICSSSLIQYDIFSVAVLPQALLTFSIHIFLQESGKSSQVESTFQLGNNNSYNVLSICFVLARSILAISRKKTALLTVYHIMCLLLKRVGILFIIEIINLTISKIYSLSAICVYNLFFLIGGGGFQLFAWGILFISEFLIFQKWYIPVTFANLSSITFFK